MENKMRSGIILCVDDDITVLNVLHDLLATLSDDYVIEIAESGQEALEVCAEMRSRGQEVSVVLSDFIMPNMRGDEFLIRMHEISPRTAKILLTGQSDLQGVKRAINEAKLYRFLEKPLNNADLLLTVKSALRAYHQEAELERRNRELEQSNATLALTLNNLRTAQGQLLQSEKMAALGQLIASVTHEINTPIGAVRSSGRSIATALHDALASMPNLFHSLDQDSLELFLRLINHANEPKTVLSTREERTIVRDLTVQLEQLNIEHAQNRAALLVQLNAQDALPNWMPLLRHPEGNLILDTANNMGIIISSINNINMAVDRVVKIIGALKSFTHFDATAEPIEASLQQGIETVITIYQGQLRQGVELVRHYQQIAPLPCLPDELHQVWTNLIHNALQAMNHQGTLSISIARIDDEAVVSVGDSGCGIPDNIRDKIFDVFFTTKVAGEGSGLGLDIVKKIVDKHHGRIEVQSEVGVGTTFSVYLPYPVK